MRSIKPYILGLSVSGYIHTKEGIPCQDACDYTVFRGRWGFISVADGLGSAPLSHIGAQIAVKSSIETAKELIAHNRASLSEIPLLMIQSARDALIKEAEREELELSSFATTLIAVAFDKNSVHTAQIGDGAVVIRTDQGLELVTSSSHSEYANEVTPITSNDMEEYLLIAHIDLPFDCMAVFTDGCQRASLKKTEQGYEPFEGFFRPVFAFATTVRDMGSANRELEEFLLSEKMSEHSEDDKTLVLAVCRI